ncbi:MAG: 50S ribosomal protein L23 [Candidatus Roizmanbacteria bacterium]
MKYLIKSPILTEKASGLTKDSVYIFEVIINANKYQISEEIEKLFKVKVQHINVVVRKGKIRKVGKKMKTRQLLDKKIAYIKLKEGKIDLVPSA